MMKRIFLYMLVSFLLNGCSDQNEPNEPYEQPKSENTQIHFSLNVEKMNTRSGGDISEKVNNLEVLVFEKTGGDYSYYYRATAEIEEDVQGNQYSVMLRSTDAEVTLLLIANHTDFQQLQVGYSVDQVRDVLLHPFTADGITSLPMYGNIVMADGLDSETTIDGITLLRSVAAVDIYVDPDVNLVQPDKFSLQTVQAYRVNNQIQVIPFADTLETENVTAPSVPNDAESIITTSFVDANGAIEASPARLYLPEAKTPTNIQSEATCLIIGGIYRGDDSSNTTVSYYRVDFKDDAQQPDGQLLRNHLYKIKITGVTGPGTTHPEEADDASIITQIYDWGDSEHKIEL